MSQFRAFKAAPSKLPTLATSSDLRLSDELSGRSLARQQCWFEGHVASKDAWYPSELPGHDYSTTTSTIFSDVTDHDLKLELVCLSGLSARLDASLDQITQHA